MLTFRDLPSIDKLLRAEALQAAAGEHGSNLIKQSLRDLQQAWRVSGEIPDWAADPAAYANHIQPQLRSQGYQPVFNLTGTVIHTNLGRALLSPETYRDVEPLVTRPMNLEFDLDTGKRGNRETFVEEKLTRLTGAEAATVVNNGAAALMLVLNSLALKRSVLVSRGELIEIGGSFRLPDIMERSGCNLREVGTTNRTHLRDFTNAIDSSTGLLLKVHPSNYHISGFTNEVPNAELASAAHAADLPVCVDLGSGTLVDLRRWGLPYEPMPQQVLASGVDLVTFSGDKLLGALQAGIVLGRKKYIDELKKNPMKRALRPDKLTLAFLEKTLALYEDPDSLADKLPLLKTLTTPVEVLEERAAQVKHSLEQALADCRVTVEPSRCQIGSGALPDEAIDSISVRINSDSRSCSELLTTLRKLPIPVIGRLHQDCVWLDMRGAERLEALCSNLDNLRS